MCVLAHIIGLFSCLPESDLSDEIRELKNEQQFGDFLAVGLGNGGNIDLYVEHHGYDIHDWFPKDNDDLKDYDEDECELDVISAFVEPQFIGEEEVIIQNSPGKDMVPILGKKFIDHEEMKIMLANYGVANGYQLWYKRNDYKSLLVLCGRNVKKGRCASKVGRKGIKENVSNGNGKEKVVEGKGKEKVAEGKGKEKVVEVSKAAEGSLIQASIKEKFLINVSLGQVRRAKQRALYDFECGLIEHYGRLWDYRDQLLKTNPGSTVKLDVDKVLGGKTYFKRFYVCFKALKDGWNEGCRKVTGLDSRLGRRHSGEAKRLGTVRHPEGLCRHSPTPHGAAVVAVPSSDRHHDGGNSSRFLGGFMGVSPAVTADTPLIAAPWRRLRGHERGGLDDDGGVVTMACKVGDDGGLGWWRWRGGSVSSPEKQPATAGAHSGFNPKRLQGEFTNGSILKEDYRVITKDSYQKGSKGDHKRIHYPRDYRVFNRNDSQCDVEETLLYGCRSTYRKSERKIIVDIRSLGLSSATLRFRWDSHFTPDIQRITCILIHRLEVFSPKHLSKTTSLKATMSLTRRSSSMNYALLALALAKLRTSDITSDLSVAFPELCNS
ncbi:hypothetical protein Tco_1505320 [Tanacetum coccineum]